MRSGKMKNEIRGSGSILTRGNLQTLHPFVYLDLMSQKEGIRDGVTRLEFTFTLSGAPGGQYLTYALILTEENVEL